MKHLLSLILLACFCVGCSSLKGPDGKIDPQKAEAIKAAFKANVATAAAMSSNDPKVRLYLVAAQPALCDLKNSHKFGPSQIDAVLKSVKSKELNTPYVLLARATLLNAYTLAFDLNTRTDIPPDSFGAGLVEVLCDGITEGLTAGP